jgi:hypothetical protein
MQDLRSSKVVIGEHVEEISHMKPMSFSLLFIFIHTTSTRKTKNTVYQHNKGQPICQFKAGDAVLLRNMLIKTKKGHKFEDQWLKR